MCLKDHKVGLVRADSGFYSKVLEYFENRNLNYIVAVKFYENIKYTIGSVTKGVSITKGLEVASLRFKPDNGKERRYIIVRKLISEYPNQVVNFYLMNLRTDIVHLLQILNYQ